MPTVYDSDPLDCFIDPASTSGGIPDPTSDPDFVLPGWTEPSGSLESSLSIEIKHDGTWYEFGWWYISASLSINSRYGEAGVCEFAFTTGSKNQQEVPFVPPANMLVRIQNRDKTKLYFTGYTRHASPNFISRNDVTFEEKQEVVISCTDLYHELEKKKNIKDRYLDKTTFFVLKDVIRRHTNLDHTQIDATKGRIVDDFRIEIESPAEVLQRVLDIEQTYTFKIRMSDSALLIDEKGASTFQIPQEITSENLYDFFSTDFKIEHDYDYIKNVIEIWFTERYSVGTANAGFGSPFVVGFTGDEDWHLLDTRDAKFRFLNDAKYYSIKENPSVAGPPKVIELVLQSNFDEPSETNEPYEIVGQRRPVVVRSSSSIEYQKRVSGGSGEITDVIPIDNSNPLTFAQGLFIAQTYLAMFSRPLVAGGGKTSNTKFTRKTFFEAGDTFSFLLASAKNYTGETIIQESTAVDVGGERRGSDGFFYPIFDFDLDFSHNFMKLDSQAKKLAIQGRKVTFGDSDSPIPASAYFFDETIYAKDCFKPRSGFLVTDSDVEVSDEITVRDVTAASGHRTSPTPNTPAFTLGPTKVSLTTI